MTQQVASMARRGKITRAALWLVPLACVMAIAILDGFNSDWADAVRHYIIPLGMIALSIRLILSPQPGGNLNPVQDAKLIAYRAQLHRIAGIVFLIIFTAYLTLNLTHFVSE